MRAVFLDLLDDWFARKRLVSGACFDKRIQKKIVWIAFANMVVAFLAVGFRV